MSNFLETFSKTFSETFSETFLTKTFLLYFLIAVVVAVLIYMSYKKFYVTKEGMSPSSRWNRSARYLNKYNGLVSDKKQYVLTNPQDTPPDPNLRGNHNFDYLLKDVGLNLKGVTPDTSSLPAVVQKGVVENAEQPSEYTNTRTNPESIKETKLSIGNTEGGLSQNPEGFKVKSGRATHF
jgi:hypothetical protein